MLAPRTSLAGLPSGVILCHRPIKRDSEQFHPCPIIVIIALILILAIDNCYFFKLFNFHDRPLGQLRNLLLCLKNGSFIAVLRITRMDILTSSEIDEVVAQSTLAVKYAENIDRESAYEILSGKIDKIRAQEIQDKKQEERAKEQKR